jgi:hypothetical protein
MVIEKCCKNSKTKNQKGPVFFSFFLRIMKFDSDMAASFVRKKGEGQKGGGVVWFKEGLFLISHSTFVHVYLNKLSHFVI